MTAALLWEEGHRTGQSRDHNGNLLLGGVHAAALAQQYGTPVLIVDLDVVDAAIETFARVAQAFGVEVSYAAKAFANVEFVAHLKSREIGLDVCSLGELITAERAGFPADRLTLHGAGKSDEELAAACAHRVGRIVVDNVEELTALAQMATANDPVDVMLRLNTGVEARTHAFVRTGGGDTKFGIHARDVPRAGEILADNPALRLRGLHSHIGSQIYDVEPYLENARALCGAAGRLRESGLTAETLVIGGGFGVPSHPAAEDPLDVAAVVAAAAQCVRDYADARNLPPFRLGIEPGRAIVALAGTTLYRVLARKRQSQRTFIIVDGGIAENPRPALYGAQHHVVPVAEHAGPTEEVTLCGRSCENDELGTVRLPAGIDRGDLVAMCATGAYTYSMAGNYNRFPRPPVVGLAAERHRLLGRRESIDDVLGRDDVNP